MSQEQVVSVRLRRGATSTPWGFRMQGGHEYGSPLYIQQVMKKSLSNRQGLLVGDRLLAIGSIQAHNMSHEQAKMEIIRAGNELDLIVQRSASAVIDHPDGSNVRSNTDAYEESTKFRGYTNPNVQSRSFKILQESLSYSEADEEGIVLPTGSTPGEGIVRKAYSEGRRRLEELSEINPRNFTADGQSPYRYSEHYLIQQESNISPDAPDASGEPQQRRRRERPDSSHAACKVYEGRVAGGSPQGRPQVDMANSSVLSPAAGQQIYLQQAHKHYQEYYQDDIPGLQPVPVAQAPVVAQTTPVAQQEPQSRQVQPVHHVPQPLYAQPAQPMQDQKSGSRPLKLVNYNFEQQYGHMHSDGRQKAVVSPQKANDFIPATQTVSSVAADLDLKIVSPVTDANVNQMSVNSVSQTQPVQQTQQVQGIVVQTQHQSAAPARRVRQRTRPTTQTTQQSSSTVTVTTETQQAQQPVTVQVDNTDGSCISKVVTAEPTPIVTAPAAQTVTQTTTTQQVTVTQEVVQSSPVVKAPAPQEAVTQVAEQSSSVTEQSTTVTQQTVTAVQDDKQQTQSEQVTVSTEVKQPEPVAQETQHPVEQVKEPEPPKPAEPVVQQTQEVVAEPAVVVETKQPEPAVQAVVETAPAEKSEAVVAQMPAEESSKSEQVTVTTVVADTQVSSQETVQVDQSQSATTEARIEAKVTEEVKTTEIEQAPAPAQDKSAAVSETIEVPASSTSESQAVSETVEVTTSQESEEVAAETVVIASAPAESASTESVEVAVSVQSEDATVAESITIDTDANVELVDDTVNFQISTEPEAETVEESSESVSFSLDTSAEAEETFTISDSSAAIEVTSDAEVSLNVSSDVTFSTDATAEETTITLSPETGDNSADAEVSLSISSDVTISTDEPQSTEAEVATVTISQDAKADIKTKKAEKTTAAKITEESKSSGSESDSKKNKPMGQKLLEQRQNEKNAKPTKVRINDSQGGVAARLARFKQK